jgi:hypothetical protein
LLLHILHEGRELRQFAHLNGYRVHSQKYFLNE